MYSIDWLSEEKYNVWKEDFMPKKKKKVKKKKKKAKKLLNSNEESESESIDTTVKLSLVSDKISDPESTS